VSCNKIENKQQQLWYALEDLYQNSRIFYLVHVNLDVSKISFTNVRYTEYLKKCLLFRSVYVFFVYALVNSIAYLPGKRVIAKSARTIISNTMIYIRVFYDPKSICKPL